MPDAAPRLFFHSTLDAPADWQRALAAHLEAFEFVVGPACEDPASIDVALLYKPLAGGFAAFRNLRAVISLSAGINQFMPALAGTPIRLARSVDSTLTQHMVGYARAAVYRYHRRFDEYERDSRDKVWRFALPRSCGDTRIAVLGLGELGLGVARALAADGFAVQGWSRAARQIEGIETFAGPQGLKAAVGIADIVLNLLPLTPQTTGILCADLFRHFRQGACLINMGRGGHVDERDLLQAIDGGQIAGATLDVVQSEPLPTHSPLWAHPRILVTPHVAGITSPATAAAQIADNIARAMDGRPMHNEVDLGRGY